METTASTGKRAVWYIVGLNLIAVAVVLNVRYNVGVAAFSSVMYAISEIYRISLGTASIICYLIFVVMQCILSFRAKSHLLICSKSRFRSHSAC